MESENITSTITQTSPTLHKMAFIHTLPNEDVTVESIGNQSTKVTLRCGCNFVQHAFPGRPSGNVLNWNTEKFDRIQADRSFFCYYM